MKRQIRICHVIGGIVGGGVEQVLINYCSQMPDIHFDLLYQYEPNQVCLTKLNRAGINCIRIPEKTKHPLKHIYSLYSFFKKGEYDAIHCHLDWFLNWLVCLCALFAGIKKRIAHHHRAYDEKTVFHKLIYLIFQCLNRIFATHYLACSYQAALNGWGKRTVKCDKVVVLDNAIDLEQFHFDQNQRNYVRSMLTIKNEVCIGHVGRFCFEKNQEYLLDVFSKVLEKRKDIALIFVGDGPDKGKIQAMTKKMNVEKFVRFVPTQDNIAPYYSAMDLFCLPSQSEGLGMVLVEAQVNGLPCLASTKVPTSAKISNDCKFLCLEDADSWISKIASAKISNHDNSAEADDYDIKLNFQKLRDLYVGQ